MRINDEIAGFIPAFDDINEFKSLHNLTYPAKTVGELVRYLRRKKQFYGVVQENYIMYNR